MMFDYIVGYRITEYRGVYEHATQLRTYCIQGTEIPISIPLLRAEASFLISSVLL